MRPLSTTTLTEIDTHDVSRVPTNYFSSPGAFCDDQSSAQIKRRLYTVSASQQTESTTQEHLPGILTLHKSIISLWFAS